MTFFLFKTFKHTLILVALLLLYLAIRAVTNDRFDIAAVCILAMQSVVGGLMYANRNIKQQLATFEYRLDNQERDRIYRQASMASALEFLNSRLESLHTLYEPTLEKAKDVMAFDISIANKMRCMEGSGCSFYVIEVDGKFSVVID